jgi:hypothetical protein
VIGPTVSYDELYPGQNRKAPHVGRRSLRWCEGERAIPADPQRLVKRTTNGNLTGNRSFRLQYRDRGFVAESGTSEENGTPNMINLGSSLSQGVCLDFCVPTVSRLKFTNRLNRHGQLAIHTCG